MKRTWKELCRQLAMPPEAVENMERNAPDFELLQEELAALTDPAFYENARAELKERLGEDPDGWKILSCMFKAMEHSYELYQEKGIPDSVFTDTMKCFPRFIGESMTNFGHYSFDRSFWTGRQLSLLLFRIGELEYEMGEYAPVPEDARQDEKQQEKRNRGENRQEKTNCGETGLKNSQRKEIRQKEKAIYLHIPSDARLTPGLCHASYRMAEKFFSRYYPEMSGCRYLCESWLMSPALRELLPGDSHILQFQQDFQVLSWDKESMAVRVWVYNRSREPLESLPERTSLQRRMKRWLLDGGSVGEALAWLRREKARQ